MLYSIPKGWNDYRIKIKDARKSRRATDYTHLYMMILCPVRYVFHVIDENDKVNIKPFKEFMMKQTREKDLEFFIEISRSPKPNGPEDISLKTLVPAFVISEIKTAFQIGFLVFIPFLIIDLVVATVLMSMGMMMVSPIIISLPFKLMLFVLVDGWTLLMGSLVQSFYVS